MTTIAAAWFEDLYGRDPDPWRFASSEYEREKYAATVAALPRPRFGDGVEVGCSIGVLTRALAHHCDRFLGIDAAESALVQARRNCPGVRFERGVIPTEWPPGSFDLIVFSEVLYYLDRNDLATTAALACTALRPGGSMLLVHYLGDTDYPLTGDEAADGFIVASGRDPALQVRADRYRIDRLDAPAMPPE